MKWSHIFQAVLFVIVSTQPQNGLLPIKTQRWYVLALNVCALGDTSIWNEWWGVSLTGYLLNSFAVMEKGEECV